MQVITCLTIGKSPLACQARFARVLGLIGMAILISGSSGPHPLRPLLDATPNGSIRPNLAAERLIRGARIRTFSAVSLRRVRAHGHSGS